MSSSTGTATTGGGSCDNLEAECNVLGMELLNVLEYIGDSLDYRKITLQVQKLSNSMDLIANTLHRLKHINERPDELEQELRIKKEELGRLQAKLQMYKLLKEG